MTTGRINQVARPPRRRARCARPTPLGEWCGDDGPDGRLVEGGEVSRPIVVRGLRRPRANIVYRVRERWRIPEGRSGRDEGPKPCRRPREHEDRRRCRSAPAQRRGERTSVLDEVVCPRTGYVVQATREAPSGWSTSEGAAATAVGCTVAGSPPWHGNPSPLTCRHGHSI
jgi:hypothetical protein